MNPYHRSFDQDPPGSTRPRPTPGIDYQAIGKSPDALSVTVPDKHDLGSRQYVAGEGVCMSREPLPETEYLRHDQGLPDDAWNRFQECLGSLQFLIGGG